MGTEGRVLRLWHEFRRRVAVRVRGRPLTFIQLRTTESGDTSLRVGERFVPWFSDPWAEDGHAIDAAETTTGLVDLVRDWRETQRFVLGAQLGLVGLGAVLAGAFWSQSASLALALVAAAASVSAIARLPQARLRFDWRTIDDDGRVLAVAHAAYEELRVAHRIVRAVPARDADGPTIKHVPVRPNATLPELEFRPEVPSLRSGGECLVVSPVGALFRDRNGWHATEMKVEDVGTYDMAHFDTPVPADGLVVGYEWLHQRKDGGPDRRFAVNRELPVIRYGAVSYALVLDDGSRVAWNMLVSSLPAFEAHRHRMASLAGTDEPPAEAPAPAAPGSRVPATPAPESPEAMLGLAPGAPWDEVSSAFRELMPQYHPDKVANMAPEIRELAERRTKELTAAYAELKARRNGRGR